MCVYAGCERLWSRHQRDYTDPNAGVCVYMQAMLEDGLWDYDPDTSVITLILMLVFVCVCAGHAERWAIRDYVPDTSMITLILILMSVCVLVQAMLEVWLRETLWSRHQYDYTEPNVDVSVCAGHAIRDYDPDTSVITLILMLMSLCVCGPCCKRLWSRHQRDYTDPNVDVCVCAGHAGRQAARDGLGADAGEYRRAGGQGVVPAVAEGTGGSQQAAGAGK